MEPNGNPSKLGKPIDVSGSVRVRSETYLI